MMDYPGVISGQNALLDKLDAFRHLTLDGHCPGLGGKDLTPILLRVLKTATKVISWKRTPEITTRHVVDDPRKVRCPQSQRAGTVDQRI